MATSVCCTEYSTIDCHDVNGPTSHWIVSCFTPAGIMKRLAPRLQAAPRRRLEEKADILFLRLHYGERIAGWVSSCMKRQVE